MQLTSSLKFFLGSGSKIKVSALQAAVSKSRIPATVTSIGGAQSGVNEQPVGEIEILRGAINRALSAYAIDSNGDSYFAIENGIQWEAERWIEYAMVLVFVPKVKTISWVRSDAIEVPTIAVEATREQAGGFERGTVGKTLQQMGVVRQHDDPHLDLTGTPRSQILELALVELINCLPEWFTNP